MVKNETELRKIFLSHLQRGTIALLDLEEKLDLSTRQVKSLIKNLTEEFEELAQTKPEIPLLDMQSGQLRCIPQLSDSDYVELNTYVRGAYLVTSNLYQVLLFVLERRSFSLLEMAQHLAYSESYTYKLLNKLKALLDFINIDASLAKKNETIISLTGDESSIRFFHYLSLVIVHGDAWLFEQLDEATICHTQEALYAERYHRLSPINKNRSRIIHAVYELALKNNCTVTPLPEEVLELGACVYQEPTFPAYIAQLQANYQTNEALAEQELIHLAFFVNYFTQELLTKVEKRALGEKLSHLDKNPIVKSCVTLLNKLSQHYALPEDRYYLLVYSLCNRFVVIHHMGLYKHMILDETLLCDNEAEQFIDATMDKLFQKYENPTSLAKLKFSFKQILSGYLLLTVGSTKKVYMEFLRHPEYKSVIENALIFNYNQQVIQVVDDYYEADIVISDTYTKEEQKQYFFFRDVFDQTAWRNLGAFLNKMIKHEGEQATLTKV